MKIIITVAVLLFPYAIHSMDTQAIKREEDHRANSERGSKRERQNNHEDADCYAQNEVVFELFPAELKRAIFIGLGNQRSIRRIADDIARCRLINRQSAGLLSEKALLVEILKRSSCWTNTGRQTLKNRTAPYYGLLHFCFVSATPDKASFVEVPPSPKEAIPGLNSYLIKPYTHEERTALCTYLAVHWLKKESCRKVDHSVHLRFITRMIRLFSSKSQLLDFLIREAEEFYSCTFLSFSPPDYISSVFSYKSLSTQKKLDSLGAARFQILKLLIPFYAGLTANGFIPINVPVLVRSQLVEFCDTASDDPQKNAELAEQCRVVAQFEQDPCNRAMWQLYEKELTTAST